MVCSHGRSETVWLLRFSPAIDAAGLDQMLDREQRCIHLLTHLQGVAPSTNSAARSMSTTAAPAEPVKPVNQASRSSRPAIFVLVPIGARHHEAGQFAMRKLVRSA